MRKLLLVLGLVVGMALAAAPAEAATTVQRNIEFNTTFHVCGETITLSGTQDIIFTYQHLANGGVLISEHYHPVGLTGTSSSGVTYRAPTLLRRSTIVVLPSGGLTSTAIYRFRLVGTGGAPTYSLKLTAHITISPTGEIITFVNNVSAECV